MGRLDLGQLCLHQVGAGEIAAGQIDAGEGALGEGGVPQIEIGQLNVFVALGSVAVTIQQPLAVPSAPYDLLAWRDLRLDRLDWHCGVRHPIEGRRPVWPSADPHLAPAAATAHQLLPPQFRLRTCCCDVAWSTRCAVALAGAKSGTD